MVGSPYEGQVAAGATWVFTRTGDTWTQQGGRLLGVGNVGFARQGTSVALSADGNVAVVGGWEDQQSRGAAWVFSRIGGAWIQFGHKLAADDASLTDTRQGYSVAVSGDAQTVIVGGPGDDQEKGAAWIYSLRPFWPQGRR